MSQLIFDFFVPGICRSSGSRSFKGFDGVGKAILAPAGEHQKPWMHNIGWTFLEKYGRPIQIVGPVEFFLIAWMRRPDSHYRRRKGAITSQIKPGAAQWHTSTPDGDKLRRAAQDALSGLAYKDDRQVAIGHDCKPYITAEQPTPGAEILIYFMKET